MAIKGTVIQTEKTSETCVQTAIKKITELYNSGV